MIINALYDYYLRETAKEDPILPTLGFEYKELKFLIDIDREGNFQSLFDTRENKRGKEYLVPQSTGRSGKNSWQTTFLLWDHTGYVLGRARAAKTKEDEEKNNLLANRQLSTFKARIESLPDKLKESDEVSAVLKFYEKDGPATVMNSPEWEACASIDGCNISFRLLGESKPILYAPLIREYAASLVTQCDETESRICSITGEKTPIARLHTPTPLPGNSAGGGQLISFQKNSGYDSYGKQQGDNAPIGINVEFGYTTALKHLLSSDTNKVRIEGLNVVFWAEKPTSLEPLVKSIFEDVKTEDDPNKGVSNVKKLLEASSSGQFQSDLMSSFYILGIEPNAARISIKLWETGTFQSFVDSINQHYFDLKIVRGPQDPEFLSMIQLLRATAFDYKTKNVVPNLFASTFKSIVTGKPYPMTLFQQTILRIRAERKVNYRRAAILKACTNRWARNNLFNAEEITEMLDTTKTNTGYLLGRTFAVLERIQSTANPDLNATILDRYYGAASTNPATVFPQLLKLSTHHLAKIEKRSSKIWLEKELGGAIDGIKSFPAYMDFIEQGEFALGYYQQKQSFFTTKQTEEGESNGD